MIRGVPTRRLAVGDRGAELDRGDVIDLTPGQEAWRRAWKRVT